MIHPTAKIHRAAFVDDKAKIGAGCVVGPCAVIDGDVELGENCVVGPHVYLTGVTKIGANNKFHAGAVIGDAPQDLKYKDAPTRTRIGDHNVFREGVTVHRPTKVGEDTIIGSHNFLMANSHVAHNCIIGNHVIMANGALLAGHVEVQDRAFISGNAAIHQFCRVGTMALMQGGAIISKDLPPFTVSHEMNILCGLNVVGLRRAGVSTEDRAELKRLYKFIFRDGRNLRAAVTEARGKFSSTVAKQFLDFIATAKRSVCSDVAQHNHHEEE
jgi:UDP-N-acetylglucosamine acyltransferase